MCSQPAWALCRDRPTPSCAEELRTQVPPAGKCPESQLLCSPLPHAPEVLPLKKGVCPLCIFALSSAPPLAEGAEPVGLQLCHQGWTWDSSDRQGQLPSCPHWSSTSLDHLALLSF